MRSVRLADRFRMARSNLRAAALDRAIHAFVRVRMSFPDAHPARYDVQRDRRRGERKFE